MLPNDDRPQQICSWYKKISPIGNVVRIYITVKLSSFLLARPSACAYVCYLNIFPLFHEVSMYVYECESQYPLKIAARGLTKSDHVVLVLVKINSIVTYQPRPLMKEPCLFFLPLGRFLLGIEGSACF